MSNPPQIVRRVRFGLFTFDFCTAELHKNGLKMPLAGQPAEVLALLLASPKDLVRREELKKQLWSGSTFVDFEHGLNKAIYGIREALGDDANNPRFIETLPRRGYRFICPVEPVVPDPPPDGSGETGALRPNPDRREENGFETGSPPLGRGWFLANGSGKGTAAAADLRADPDPPAAANSGRRPETASAVRRYGRPLVLLALALGAAVAVIFSANATSLCERTSDGAAGLLPVPPWQGRPRGTPARIESLAVLPFENLSHDFVQESFADGMTDALICELGKVSTLRVVSRTSAMQYKRTKKRLSEIARELNVDAVVEGSVLRSGDRVRITAQLIEAGPERHLWSENYRRDAQDVFATQSEVAREIAEQVQVAVTSREKIRLTGARPSKPKPADSFLRAAICGE
jgi:TolB-like protein/DNA-binding winged helix-turn-helix (wHTH) protein